MLSGSNVLSIFSPQYKITKYATVMQINEGIIKAHYFEG